MKVKRITKSALFTSVLSLVLCASMLIGTTFAWFTDSVTSGNNIIAAGNLDVELYHSNANVSDKSVAGATDLFLDLQGNEILWEPGVVSYENLTVANVGSLALKYELSMNFTDTNTLEGHGLSEVLKVGVVENGITATNREDVINSVTEWKDLASFKMAGELKAGETDSSKEVGLVIYWQPSENDNLYNANNGKLTSDKEALNVDLGIVLYATQLQHEVDSFGPDYDADATWELNANDEWFDPAAPEETYVISTAEELAGLAKMVNSGNNFRGKTITLGANIDLGNVRWTPIGTQSSGFHGTLDGAGYTISNLYVEEENTAGLVGYALYGGNVKNLTVENAVVKAHDYAGVIMGRGYTDIDNCHVKNATVITTPYQDADGNYDGGAKAGGVIGQMMEGSGNTVTNCSVTDVKIYAFRDLGGVVGMVHNNNSASGNTASNVTLGYILLDKITEDENENAGAIYGRVQSSATVEPAKDSAENQAYTQVYAVHDADTLTSLANMVNNGDNFKGKTVVMLDDIDLGGAAWTPIGKTFGMYEFAGTFDGQGHTVSNFNVDSRSGSALFGFVRGGSPVIKNVTVKNVTATGSDYVAGVVGQLYGVIENCHAINVNATATPFDMGNGTYDGGAKAGGVVGWMESGSIYKATGCTATGCTIRAYRDLGGTIGMAHNGNVITDCKAFNCELFYVAAPGTMDGGKVNENMGEVIGRRGSNVVETGTYFENVTLHNS